MKIEKIKKLAGEKYSILFDNGEKLVTYEDIIIKNNLLYKKEIEVDIYNDLIKQNCFYEVYNKALNYIMKRMRSKKEIIEYIKKYTNDESYIDRIIDRLTELNLINDSLFAKSYISDRLYLSNDGINKIKNALYEYDIKPNIIEEEISLIDKNMMNNKLNKLITKKVCNDHNHSEYMLKQKIINDMINLGYNKENIVDILDKLEYNNNIDNDFNKIYNKYKNKYSGYELTNCIKQKLYQKGYSSSIICDILSKKMD